ncbi:MAG: hypothetical protein AB8E15_01510 [Bdellovibrionales bacterium]
MKNLKLVLLAVMAVSVMACGKKGTGQQVNIGNNPINGVNISQSNTGILTMAGNYSQNVNTFANPPGLDQDSILQIGSNLNSQAEITFSMGLGNQTLTQQAIDANPSSFLINVKFTDELGNFQIRLDSANSSLISAQVSGSNFLTVIINDGFGQVTVSGTVNNYNGQNSFNGTLSFNYGFSTTLGTFRVDSI